MSVILAHPRPGSFNHAIAECVMETLRLSGYDLGYHDLYAEAFDPVLPDEEIPKGARLDPVIQRHCDEIQRAEGIVIVHPNWWGQPPAVLKGWVDRVMRAGVAYEFLNGDGGEGVPVGLLSAQVALVFNTSNTPRARELKIFGDPLEALWRDCIFGLCGVTSVRRKMYGVVVTSTAAERQAWLRDVEATVRQCFPPVER